MGRERGGRAGRVGRGSLLERTIHPEYRTPAVRGDKWLSGGGEPPLPVIDVMPVTGLDLMPCVGAAKGQDSAGKAAADLTWRYQARGDQTHPAWAQLVGFLSWKTLLSFETTLHEAMELLGQKQTCLGC